MVNKLTNIKTKKNDKILTDNTKAKFKIYISDLLEKQYSFNNVQSKESHAFCTFLGKTLGKDWDYVIKNYGRETDKTDKKSGQQILHFELNKKGRIHGYLNNGVFVLIRFDPNHNFHD